MADALPEFEGIAALFRPLTEGVPEARGLADDVAVLPGPDGLSYVLTQDAIVAGVHFLPDDPPALVARKLLRANLSDLAAKGARPYGVVLTCAWPVDWGGEARAAFAAGLAEDLKAFGARLFGGDTVSTPGPASFSLTAIGTVRGRVPARADARPGQVVIVTGTIGDGRLGLLAATGALDASEADRACLIDRYRLPRPRCGMEAALADCGATMDVSDGLVADAGRIAEAAGVAVRLVLDSVPLSPAALSWLSGRERAAGLVALATGGDDYEILLTCDPDRAPGVLAAAADAGFGAAVVGRVEEGSGVRCFVDGAEVRVDRPGWTHA